MIVGTDKNDNIKAKAGDDTVDGGLGKDKIDGGDGNDSLSGGAGNDQLKGGKGEDILEGGDGDDKLNGQQGDDNLSGGAGKDDLKGGDGQDTLDGGDGDDKLNGQEGDDMLAGGAGNDDLKGGSGNDTLEGGTGDDKLKGGVGDDSLLGGDGDDRIFGDGSGSGSGSGSGDMASFNDYLDGGAGNDWMEGQQGDDTVLGGAGDDVVIGDSFGSGSGSGYGKGSGSGSGSGYDLWADSVQPTENGSGSGSGSGSGDVSNTTFNDYLDGGAGNDIVLGMQGDDEARYVVGENAGASDKYAGGRGIDTLTLDMTHDEWFRADIQQDIADFLAFIAANTDPVTGEANSNEFQFQSFDLIAREFENLRVFVDGVEFDPTDHTPVANDDSGNVLEDDGAIAFGTVLANDDVQDLVLSITLVSGPSEGVLDFVEGTGGVQDGNGTLDQIGGRTVGSFTFDPNDDFEDLAVGETRDVSFTYEVTDADGDTTQATVTITVTGQNDAPIISVGDSVLSGGVTEHADLSAGENSTTHTTGGHVNFSDVDVSDTHVSSFVANGAGYRGAFTITQPSTTNTTTDGDVTWSFDIADADIDDLREGQVLTQSYDITVDDGNGGTDTTTVTVTITGTNDAPIIDSAAVVEHFTETVAPSVYAASGAITFSDVDTLDSHVVTRGPLSVTGDYQGFAMPHGPEGIRPEDIAMLENALVVNPDGTWSFGADAGDQIERLAEGMTITLTSLITVTDDSGAANDTDTQLLTISITGTNDAPEILSSVTSGSVTEIADGAAGENVDTLSTAGTIEFRDIDQANTHTVSVAELGAGYRGSVSAVVSTDTEGFGNQNNGVVDWQFDINDAEIDDLREGQVLTQSYDITIDDGEGGTVTETVTVTIAGTNDRPIITSAAVDETLVEGIAPTALSTSGVVAFTDVDSLDSHVVTRGAITVAGEYQGFAVPHGPEGIRPEDIAMMEAALLVNPDGTWSFNLPASEMVDRLADGMVMTMTAEISVTDDSGAADDTATQTLTLTLIGTNDAPEITSAVTAGSITEIADGTAGENATTHKASGTIAFSDLDQANTHTVSVSANDTGYLGAMNASVTTDTEGYGNQHAGQINWTFEVEDSAIDYLAAGQTLTQSYTVIVTDNDGASDTEVVTVTITGTNDTPVIGAADDSGSVQAEVIVPEASVGTGDMTFHVAQYQGYSTNNLTTMQSIIADPAAYNVSLYEIDTPHVDFADYSNGGNYPASTQFWPAAVQHNQTHTHTGVNDYFFARVTTEFEASSAGTYNFRTYNDDGLYLFIDGHLVINDSGYHGPAHRFGNINLTAGTHTLELFFFEHGGAAVLELGVGLNGSGYQLMTEGALGLSGTGGAVDLTDSGSIAFTDVDLADTHSVTVTPDSAGYHGELTAAIADAATGDGSGSVDWNFSVPNADLEYLAAGETRTQTYTVTVTDNNGASDSQQVTITLTGTNEAPVIGAADTAASITEIADGTAGENTTTHSVDGSIDFSDVDDIDTHTVSVSANGSGYRGSLTASVADAATGDNSGRIDWNFLIADSVIDDLAAGQTLTQSYDVTVNDGQGGTDTETITVTITGTNDAPVIEAASEVEGAVVESGNLDDGTPVPGTPAASGTMVSSDVDQGATATWTGDSSGAYGDFAIDPATGNWTYTLDNANPATDALAEGQVETETFVVTVTDDQGATDTEVVTITVTGTNDVPVAEADTGSATVTSEPDTATTTADTGFETPEVGNGFHSAFAYNPAGTSWTFAGSSGVTGNGSGFTSWNPSAPEGDQVGFLQNDASISQSFVGSAGVYSLDFSAAQRAFGSDGANPDSQSIEIYFDGALVGTVQPASTAYSDHSLTFSVPTDGTHTLEFRTNTLVSDIDATAFIDNVQLLAAPAVTGSVATNDSDVDTGAVLSFALDAPIAGLTMDGAGNWVFDVTDPAYAYLASGELVDVVADYTVTDEFGAYTSSTLTLTLTGTNDGPVIGAADVAGSVTEIADLAAGENATTHVTDGTIAFTDVDLLDGHTVSAAANGAGYRGAMTAVVSDASTGDGSGEVTWTFSIEDADIDDLAAGEVLVQTYDVTIDDGNGGTDTETVTISIVGTNDAPIIQDQAPLGFDEAGATDGIWRVVDGYGGFNWSTNGGIGGQDSNNQGDILATPIAGTPSGPNAAWNGHASKISTITKSDGSPFAFDSASFANLTNPMDWGGNVTSVTLNGYLNGVLVGTETVTLGVVGDFSNYNSSLPVIDALQMIPTGPVSSINGSNSGWFGFDDFATTNAVIEDDTLSTSGSLTATDVDGDTLSWTVQGGGAGVYGTLSVDNNGNWLYTLNNAAANVQALAEGQSETESFTLEVSDGNGGTDTEVVHVVVGGSNDGPTLDAGATNAVEDGPSVTFDLSAFGDDLDNDDDGSSLTYTVTGQPSEGSASISGTTLTFDPGSDFQDLAVDETRDVTVTVTAEDQHGAQATNTVTVTVSGTNDGPTANNDLNTGELVEQGFWVAGNAQATGNVLGNDTDPDTADVLSVNDVNGTAVTASGVVILGIYGSLTIAADGTWTYDLDNADPDTDALEDGDVVQEVFTYTIDDGNGGSDTATLTLSIEGSADNEPPVVTDDSFSVDEDVATVLDLADNDTDANGDAVDVASINGQAVVAGDVVATDHGQVTVNGDGTVTYLSDEHYSGSDSFTYTGTDGSEESLNTATVEVDVEAVADAPEVAFAEEPVSGDVSFLTGDILVGDSNFGQWYGSLAPLSDGGFVVSYTSVLQDSSSGGIFVQRYDASGNAVGSEIQANTYTYHNQSFSDVTTFADGSFVVVWGNYTRSGWDTSDSIQAQMFDANGNKVGSDFLVNTTTSGKQERPEVTTLDDGSFVVTWMSEYMDTGNTGNPGYAVAMQRYASDGTPIGGETKVNTYIHNHQDRPTIASLSDGGFVIAWESNGQDGSGEGIYAQRFDENSNPIGSEFHVSTTTSSNQSYPHVDGLAGGGFVVAWAGTGANAQIFDANGDKVGGEFQASATAGSYPTVTGLADGGFLLTSNSWTAPGGDGGDLVGQRYDATGTAIGDEFIINAGLVGNQGTIGAGSGSTTIQLADGNIVSTWRSNTNNSEVFVRVYDTDGGGAGGNLEDEALAVNLSAALVDTDGSETLSLELSGFPAGATFNLGAADGANWVIPGAESVDLSTLEMMPPLNWNGTFTLNVTATATESSNGDTASSSASAEFTITPVNDAPEAYDGVASGDEDTPIDGTVTGYDLDGDALTFSLVSGTSNGSVTLNSDGTFTYNPNLNFNGTDSFTFVANDGEYDSAVQTITITVDPVNDDPEAAALAVGGNEDTSISGTVNATDIEGDSLTFAVETQGSNGSVVMATDGSFVYTPDEHFSGSDSFTYEVSDGNGGSDTETVSVDIEAVADAPAIVFSGGAGSETPVASTSEIFVDQNGFQQRFISGTPLENGGFAATWSSYNEDGSYWGVFTQTFNADGSANSPASLVNTHTSHHQLYSAASALDNGGYVVAWSSYNQDGSGYGVYKQAFDVSGNKVGAEIRVSAYSSSDQYLPEIETLEDGSYIVSWMSNGQDGSGWGVYARRYEEDGTAIGAETRLNDVTYRSQAYVDISALEDGGYIATWASEYQYPDNSNYGVFAQRFDANGNEVGSEFAVNTYTYSHQYVPDSAGLTNGGFVISWDSNGQDGSGWGVYAQVYDATGAKVGGEFRVNDYTSSTQIRSNVLALDDGGFLITFASYNQDGNHYGVFGQRYDADGNEVGSEFLINETTYGAQNLETHVIGDQSIQLKDGTVVSFWDHQYTDVVMRLFDVGATFEGDEEAPISIDLSTVELVDQDGSETLDIVLSGYPAGSVFNIGYADGANWVIENAHSIDLSTLTMTTPVDYNGTFNLEVTATATETSNGDTATSTGTASVKVKNTNDDPIASDSATSGDEDTGITAAFDVTDIDGDHLSFTILSDGANGTTTVNNDGTFTYTPDAHFSGTDSFTYEVDDGEGGTDTATVTITVDPVADAPRIQFSGDSGADTPEAITGDIGVDTNGYYQRYASGAALEDGNFVATWSSQQDGSGYGIYIQIFDENGVAQSSVVQANTYHANNQVYSSATSLANGNFVVVWDSYGQDGSYHGIYKREFDASGNPVGAEERVNSTTYHHQHQPEITSLEGGDYVVTWSSYTQDGSSWGIYGQRYAEDGSTIGGEFLVNTTTYDSQLYTDVSGTPDGGFIVTWSSHGGDGSGWGIEFQRFDANGDKLGVETQVNSYISSTQQVPDSAVLLDGSFVIVWESYYQDGHQYGVYMQRFDSDGNALGGEVRVNNITNYDQNRADVLALDDGGYLVTWRSQYQDGSGWGVFGQRFDQDGNEIGSEFSLAANTSGDQYWESHQIGNQSIQLVNGNVVSFWNEYGRDVEMRIFDVRPTYEGDEDAAIEVNLDGTALVDQDGSETFELVFSGQPAGTVFNLGHADGATWVIENAQSVDLSTLTLTTPQDWNGSFTLEVAATSTEGANGDTATATRFAEIVVNAINDAPVADTLVLSGNEDTVLNGTVTGSDVEGDAITFSVVSGPANGSVSMNSDGTFSYTPNANYNGGDSFTFVANDGTEDSFEQVVAITVNPVNDAPTASDIAVAGNEDTVISGNVVGADIDGDALTFSVLSGPTNGTVSMNPDGSFDYTPIADFNGSDSFTYIANDGSLDSAPQTVSLTVNPVNDAPVAANQLVGGLEDTVLSGNLVATDVDGDALTYSVHTGPSNGSVVVNPDGSFDYTPNANFNGNDSFTFIANDGALDSAPETVYLDVIPVNDAPVDAWSGLATNEDAPDVFISIDDMVTDVDIGDTHSLTSVTNYGSGVADLAGDGSGFTWRNAGQFEYLGEGETADNYVEFTAIDSAGASVSGWGTVTVTGENDLPEWLGDVFMDPDDYHNAKNVTINVLEVDPNNIDLNAVLSASGTIVFGDYDLTDIHIATVEQAGIQFSNGTAVVTSESTTGLGDVEWSMNLFNSNLAHLAGGEVLTEQLYLHIEDAAGIRDTEVITINFVGANDDPYYWGAINAITDEDQSTVTFDLLQNSDDLDNGDVLSVDNVTVTSSDGRTVTFTLNAAAGLLMIDPGQFSDLEYGEQISLTANFNIIDGNGGSVARIAELAVNGLHDAPVAADDAVSTNVNQQVMIDVLGNDSPGDDSDVLTITSASVTSGGGSVSILNGTLNYDQNSAYAGLASGSSETVEITYTVTDDDGLTDTAIATVTVNGTTSLPGVSNYITLTTGNDWYTAGTGNQQVSGLSGVDTINADFDTWYRSTWYYYDTFGADIVYAGSGGDTVYGDGRYYQSYYNYNGSHYANGGADVLYGQEDGDRLIGDINQIYVQYVTQYMRYNGGADAMFGQGGNDWMAGDSDLIQNEYSYRGTADFNGGIDTMDGGDGDDYLVGDFHNAQHNQIYNYGYWTYTNFNGAGDIMTGGTGNDTLVGDMWYVRDYNSPNSNPVFRGGADDIKGGAGNDNIYGDFVDVYINGWAYVQAGADTIEGGEGNDNMWGDKGFTHGSSGSFSYTGAADVFVFNPNSGVDSIHDFQDGVDKLDVSGYGFTSAGDMIIGVYNGSQTYIQFSATDVVYLQSVISITDDDFIF